MKKSFILVMSFLAINVCIASDSREIVLSDGSIISGQVLAFDGRQYTIQTDSLGVVKLDSHQVQVIRSPGGAPLANHASPSLGISQNDISVLQQQMLADPQTMNLIHSLQSDPQFQAVLNDPQIMQAIAAGDFGALLENPKFKALLNNPVIQQIQPSR